MVTRHYHKDLKNKYVEIDRENKLSKSTVNQIRRQYNGLVIQEE